MVKEQDCQDPGCGFQTGAAPFALEFIFAAQTQNAAAGIRTGLRAYLSLSLQAGANKQKKSCPAHKYSFF